MDWNGRRKYILYRVGDTDINNKITIKSNSEIREALITITTDDGNTTQKMKLNDLIAILENTCLNFYGEFNIKKSKIINYVTNNNTLVFNLLYPYKCTGYHIVNEFNNLYTISDNDKNSIIFFNDNDELKTMLLQKYIEAKYNFRFNFLYK